LLKRFQNKLAYFSTCLLKTLRGTGLSCPSCGGGFGQILDRKAWVTALGRCSSCQLLYRTPTTTEAENERFYQEAYTEGFTTDVPDAATLEQLKAAQFVGSEKHYRHYLAVLSALGVQAGSRVFDFGCSWGYGSYQLRQAGYEVDSFEVSQPRSRYAEEKLGVQVLRPEEAAAGSYDVFFSAHVIEHVPSVEAMLCQGLRLLKPGGLLVTFSPNGSAAFRQAAPLDWHLMWGLTHPQLVDEVFLRRRFSGQPLLMTSAPLLSFHEHARLQSVLEWDQAGLLQADLSHVELLFVVKKA
jgi:2-polyprenyl-3-methyl-5-hydroxy-6-metoxy-1,4-benzoquinol methylase